MLAVVSRSLNRSAIARMFAASLLFGAMSAFIKALGGRVDTATLVFVRASLGLPLWWWLLHRHGLSAIPKNKTMVLGRCVFGVGATTLSFYSYGRLPLGDSFLLNQFHPVLVIGLAALLLAEIPPRYVLISTVASLSGVALIVQPSWQLGNPAGLIMALSTLSSALATICLRRASASDPPLVIVFAFAAFATVASAPFAAATWQMPTPPDALLLLGMVVSASWGQYLMTTAYSLAPAPIVASAGYASVLMGLVLGYAIWNEIPTYATFVGGALILGAEAFLWLVGAKKFDAKGSP